jgi:hypothetical protein
MWGACTGLLIAVLEQKLHNKAITRQIPLICFTYTLNEYNSKWTQHAQCNTVQLAHTHYVVVEEYNRTRT